MRSALADGVHMAACDEDVVVLDTRSDLYSCLPDASPHLIIGDGWIDGPDALIAHLSAAGFVTSAPVPPRHSIPPRPVRALPLPTGRARLADEIGFWRAALDAWRLGPGRRPLQALLADPAPAPCAAHDLEKIARLTAVFVERLPWDPNQGACLYRAWLLRRLLRMFGQDATWVFAVKTWPFGAHCWLQVGDAILDDDPDRLNLYTPILAV
ncbi:hypothetical protein QE419_002555 [Brevundimonas vesicularis]|uniref:lasso peptide biosynthesis B2 protein n=1 Tax=Brevundimonas vesicularis TaxID=41276 RepID=UPI00277F64EB|nr:lasso peptide biosynthesis B2 protein [Brevundimonas vesicularis]MDQ1193789.1 hypothetical protein [Brevundimonas vesicularis]